MKLILKPRRTGKTYDLIKTCAAEGGYIVTATFKEAQRVAKLAAALEVSIPFPITFYEFVHGKYYGSGVRAVFIDNIDLCLASISSVPVRAITLTEEKRA